MNITVTIIVIIIFFHLARSAPRYDERFLGFGWNKVSYIMELDAMGFVSVTMTMVKMMVLMVMNDGDGGGGGGEDDDDVDNNNCDDAYEAK